MGRLERRSARRADITGMLRSLLNSVVAVSLPRWPGVTRSREDRERQRAVTDGRPQSDRSRGARPSAGRETGEHRENVTRLATVPKGRYRIVGDLGAGAFGNVSLAEDETNGQEV